MNRITQLFQRKKENILSVFFTAGFPALDSTVQIIRSLAGAGADMIEIGIPFSDPMADGPVIQKSSDAALRNGMSLSRLFSQLAGIRDKTDIPLLLMGYLNPVLQYGMDRFCEDCEKTGIDGVILPDMPLEVFLEKSGTFTRKGSLKELFDTSGLHAVFLISPETSAERIMKLDAVSGGFIYMVSSSSTTGKISQSGTRQHDYFERIRKMQLRNPAMIGFGISDHERFEFACRHASGAIIGSAFVEMLGSSKDLDGDIKDFVVSIRG